LKVHQLEYFLAIVDHAGFNRAAAHLHLAQPSLSQAIRELERRLGVPLFHRIGRRVVLTDAGRALIGPARQVLRDLDNARATIEALKGLTTGAVDIASMRSPAIEPLSSIISRFRGHYPRIAVRIREELTLGPILEAVRTGAAELGLLGLPKPLTHAGIQVHVLQTQRFVLIAGTNHPLATRERITTAELAGVDLIVGQHGTSQRQVIDDIMAQGTDMHIAVESAHREMILPLVLKGVGVAVTTEAWASLARQLSLRVVPLEPAIHLHTCLVHRRAALTPAAAAFLHLATSQSSTG
jgi:DNA-binding transcriptional LysR family regulator